MGDPVLNKKAKKVVDFNEKLHTLLDDMADTMYNEDGVGLAAPQVGILRRAVVVDIGTGLIELINPQIIAQEGEQTDVEGCLSVVDYVAEVTRPNYVKVKAQDRNGKDFEIEGDHLEGILFVERVEKGDK